MKKVLEFIGVVLGLVLIVGLIVGFAFFSEETSLFFKGRFGVRRADIDRKIFESTKTYNGSMANDLASHRLEWQMETDATAKNAIVAFVVRKYSDYDSSNLNDASLQEFLDDARNGTLLIVKGE